MLTRNSSRLLVWRSTAAFVLAAAISSALGAPGTIVINEIHYQPPNKTKLEEFIELYNPGTVAISLDGWHLDQGVEFAFPAGTNIAGGGYLVVAQSPSAFQARFGFAPLGPWIGNLKNSGEQIQLLDGSGNVVDEVNYEAGFP